MSAIYLLVTGSSTKGQFPGVRASSEKSFDDGCSLKEIRSCLQLCFGAVTQGQHYSRVLTLPEIF